MRLAKTVRVAAAAMALHILAFVPFLISVVVRSNPEYPMYDGDLHPRYLTWFYVPVAGAVGLGLILSLTFGIKTLAAVFDFPDVLKVFEVLKTAALFTLIIERASFEAVCLYRPLLEGCFEEARFRPKELYCLGFHPDGPSSSDRALYDQFAPPSQAGCTDEQLQYMCSCDVLNNNVWAIVVFVELATILLGLSVLNDIESNNSSLVAAGYGNRFWTWVMVFANGIAALAWGLFYLLFETHVTIDIGIHVIGFFIAAYFLINVMATVSTLRHDLGQSEAQVGVEDD